MIMIVYLQVPLLLKEIESKTEDSSEKMTIKKILQMKESSLSNTGCSEMKGKQNLAQT